MNVDEFIWEVRKMREAQKAYFRTRAQSHLIDAKKHEAAVDRALAQGIAYPVATEETPAEHQQMGLFEESDHETR